MLSFSCYVIASFGVAPFDVRSPSGRMQSHNGVFINLNNSLGRRGGEGFKLNCLIQNLHVFLNFKMKVRHFNFYLAKQKLTRLSLV